MKMRFIDKLGARMIQPTNHVVFIRRQDTEDRRADHGVWARSGRGRAWHHSIDGNWQSLLSNW